LNPAYSAEYFSVVIVLQIVVGALVSRLQLNNSLKAVTTKHASNDLLLLRNNDVWSWFDIGSQK